MFQHLGESPKSELAIVDWFKGCAFILFDSIISTESEMPHIDGF